MGYSIVEFAKSLRGDDCKIRNTPNLIFLCGGETAKSKSGLYRSCRDYFYRHLESKAAKIAQRVKLAEDVNDWFRRDEFPFPDLLELENYLADLANITVLFVESPGSIAELGAFAASDRLRPKTLVVFNTFYERDRTFITDGPVRKIKNENKKLVRYYEWDPRHLNSPATKKEFSYISSDLTAFLKSRDKSLPKQQGFDKGKHGHVLLMVADLIRIAGVATATDIADCLRALGREVDNKQLDRYLSLLESMSFIRRVFRSDRDFYVSAGLSKPLIRYAYQPSAPLKEIKRINYSVRNALDPMRKSILAKSLRKARKQGPRNV